MLVSNSANLAHPLSPGSRISSIWLGLSVHRTQRQRVIASPFLAQALTTNLLFLGLTLKEGSHINKSLLTLGTVIGKLAEGQG